MNQTSKEYQTRGRLSQKGSSIDQYRRTLENDLFEPSEPHWRRISKNTITLFQVLIDQDLKDLVEVLEHYPRYIEWVCEHFRYAYSYSENSADIDAASQLLTLGEPYFSKQFVRNLIRKLPNIDNEPLESLQKFVALLQEQAHLWHPLILNHYCDSVMAYTIQHNLHPLQRIALTKGLASLKKESTFDYSAEDRDAVLDIPYMN